VRDGQIDFVAAHKILVRAYFIDIERRVSAVDYHFHGVIAVAVPRRSDEEVVRGVQHLGDVPHLVHGDVETVVGISRLVRVAGVDIGITCRVVHRGRRARVGHGNVAGGVCADIRECGESFVFGAYRGERPGVDSQDRG